MVVEKQIFLEGISLIAKGRGLRNANIFKFNKKNEKEFLIKNNLEIKNNHFDIEIFSEKKNDKFKKIIKVNDDLSKDEVNFINQSLYRFLYFYQKWKDYFNHHLQLEEIF